MMTDEKESYLSELIAERQQYVGEYCEIGVDIGDRTFYYKGKITKVGVILYIDDFKTGLRDFQNLKVTGIRLLTTSEVTQGMEEQKQYREVPA